LKWCLVYKAPYQWYSWWIWRCPVLHRYHLLSTQTYVMYLTSISSNPQGLILKLSSKYIISIITYYSLYIQNVYYIFLWKKSKKLRFQIMFAPRYLTGKSNTGSLVCWSPNPEHFLTHHSASPKQDSQ
jgi:hypothetical protein